MRNQTPHRATIQPAEVHVHITPTLALLSLLSQGRGLLYATYPARPAEMDEMDVPLTSTFSRNFGKLKLPTVLVCRLGPSAQLIPWSIKTSGEIVYSHLLDGPREETDTDQAPLLRQARHNRFDAWVPISMNSAYSPSEERAGRCFSGAWAGESARQDLFLPLLSHLLQRSRVLATRQPCASRKPKSMLHGAGRHLRPTHGVLIQPRVAQHQQRRQAPNSHRVPGLVPPVYLPRFLMGLQLSARLLGMSKAHQGSRV